MFRVFLVSAVAAAGLTVGAAQAATFDLSYERADGVLLTALVAGDLQADGDTVVVSGISDVFLDGVSVSTLIENVLAAGGGDPTLSLLGTETSLNAFACADMRCAEGFGFFWNGSDARFGSAGEFGDADEAFSAARYSLSADVSADVPAPAAAPLLIAGIAGLAMLRRRGG